MIVLNLGMLKNNLSNPTSQTRRTCIKIHELMD